MAAPVAKASLAMTHFATQSPASQTPPAHALPSSAGVQPVAESGAQSWQAFEGAGAPLETSTPSALQVDGGTSALAVSLAGVVASFEQPAARTGSTKAIRAMERENGDHETRSWRTENL